MNALYILSVVAGLGYGYFIERPHGPARVLFKTLPVALLAVAAWLGGAPVFLVAGLALSALGDFFLAFRGERAFMAGLVAFLTAHLAYIRLFFAGQNEEWTAGVTFLAGAILIVIVTTSVFRILRPRLGPMHLPVAVYTGVIAAMAVSALARGPDPLLLAGAGLFMASDMALAFETFPATANSANEKAAPMRWRGYFIWYAYIAGQDLIAAAFLTA